MKLRDGSTTRDRRLDRIESFDEESRKFPVRTLVPKKPRSYTWRCGVWLNQGMEGACVGFGWAHELAARPVEVKGLTERFAREEIYWPAQKIDEFPGGSYPGANPQSEGSSVLAGAKVCVSLGAIEGYRWGFSLKDLVLGVGFFGPAVLGVAWYENMMEPDETGYISPTGAVAGGHCICCIGVDIKRKRFTLHNSWGKAWGRDGRAYISFAGMEALLARDGESCFPYGRHLINTQQK